MRSLPRRRSSWNARPEARHKAQRHMSIKAAEGMTYEPIVPRARIGFIIPSSNRMVEPQMQRFMPAGVVPHFTRIGMTHRHKAPLEQLIPPITEAATLLADSQCHRTVLPCTGTSLVG